MRLSEAYRPRQWSEVVGQAKAIETIDRLRKRGLSGRAYFMAGPALCAETLELGGLECRQKYIDLLIGLVVNAPGYRSPLKAGAA